jgi:hypothetical protein
MRSVADDNRIIVSLDLWHFYSRGRMGDVPNSVEIAKAGVAG